LSAHQPQGLFLHVYEDFIAPDECAAAALLCRALAVECVGAMSRHVSDSGVTGEQLTAACKLLDGSAGEGQAGGAANGIAIAASLVMAP
jgi:hypothetical protein